MSNTPCIIVDVDVDELYRASICLWSGGVARSGRPEHLEAQSGYASVDHVLLYGDLGRRMWQVGNQ